MQDIFSLIQIISLGIFLFFVAAKTVYLRRKEKISAIKINIFTSEGKKHVFEIIMFSLVFFWTIILLFYSLNKTFDISVKLAVFSVFDLVALKIFGVFLELCGFVIFIIAIINMGSSWRLGIDEKNPGKLITSGIYSISRHPIYLFFDLYFFGTFFVTGDIIFFAFAIMLGSIMHVQVLREEKFLIKVFGNIYTHYMENVSRYFSFKFFYNHKAVKYPFRVIRAEQDEQL